MTNAIFYFMWRQEPQEHTLGSIWGRKLVSGENILRGCSPPLPFFFFKTEVRLSILKEFSTVAVGKKIIKKKNHE